MHQLLRAEVAPTDLYDDATLMLLRCPSSEDGYLALVQSERRGSMDDETIDMQMIPMYWSAMTKMVDVAARCPDVKNGQCPCAWHQTVKAPLLLQEDAWFRRPTYVPFFDPAQADAEAGIWHYGAS